MYETAPATVMLCTHCAACSRPLVDAVSVEAGMGPDCRKKYLKAETSPENRIEVNAIVFRLAQTLSTKGRAETAKQATDLIGRVRELGFAKLADKLADVYITVRIDEEAGVLSVDAPYDENFTAMVRRIPGRRWNGETKRNTFPAAARIEIFRVLRACFPGAAAIGPKGGFLIPV